MLLFHFLDTTLMGKNSINSADIHITLPDTQEGQHARIKFAQRLLEDKSVHLSKEEILDVVKLTEEKFAEILQNLPQPVKKEDESPVAGVLRDIKKATIADKDTYAPKSIFPSPNEKGISITLSEVPGAARVRQHFALALWDLDLIQTRRDFDELGL